MSPKSTLAVKSTCLVVILLLSPIWGCGGGDGRQRVVVSGAVSYAGQPLEMGVIRFIPQSGTEASVCGTAIIGGEYILDDKGGVPVGSYKIEIRRAAALDKEAAQIDEDDDSPSRSANHAELPAKYNIHSQLKITIDPGNGKIVKDFQLAR